MEISQLNIIAIFIASISRFVLGGLWYGPVFGKAWMQETGITEEKAKESNMIRTFSLTFLASLVIAINLAFFLGAESSLQSGVFYGFLVGFAWVAMSMGTNDLFEQRSFKLFAINAGYHVIAFIIMGAILGAWH